MVGVDQFVHKVRNCRRVFYSEVDFLLYLYQSPYILRLEIKSHLADIRLGFDFRSDVTVNEPFGIGQLEKSWKALCSLAVRHLHNKAE